MIPDNTILFFFFFPLKFIYCYEYTCVDFQNLSQICGSYLHFTSSSQTDRDMHPEWPGPLCRQQCEWHFPEVHKPAACCGPSYCNNQENAMTSSRKRMTALCSRQHIQGQSSTLRLKDLIQKTYQPKLRSLQINSRAGCWSQAT